MAILLVAAKPQGRGEQVRVARPLGCGPPWAGSKRPPCRRRGKAAGRLRTSQRYCAWAASLQGRTQSLGRSPPDHGVSPSPCGRGGVLGSHGQHAGPTGQQGRSRWRYLPWGVPSPSNRSTMPAESDSFAGPANFWHASISGRSQAKVHRNSPAKSWWTKRSRPGRSLSHEPPGRANFRAIATRRPASATGRSRAGRGTRPRLPAPGRSRDRDLLAGAAIGPRAARPGDARRGADRHQAGARAADPRCRGLRPGPRPAAAFGWATTRPAAEGDLLGEVGLPGRPGQRVLAGAFAPSGPDGSKPQGVGGSVNAGGTLEMPVSGGVLMAKAGPGVGCR